MQLSEEFDEHAEHLGADCGAVHGVAPTSTAAPPSNIRTGHRPTWWKKQADVSSASVIAAEPIVGQPNPWA